MDKSRLRLVALIVAAAIFMHNLDSTLIATSLPQIAASFGLGPVDLSVGITAYILASAAFLPISGWLADRYSARRVFAAAVAIFTLSSAACGAATTLTQFVLARVLQGLGGALMTPVGRTVVLRHSGGRQLLFAIALITWPGLLAPVIAPVLGGLITTYSSWRWNFLLNLPLGTAVLVLALRHVPADRGTDRRPLDVVGLLLSSSALFGLLYGLESFTAQRTQSTAPLWFALGGGGALAATFWHLRRTPHPLLDLSAYQWPTYRMINGNVALIFRASIAATPFLLPLLLQLVYGLSALQAGSYIMIYFIGNVVMKPATNPLLRRFGFRRVLVVNGVLSGLATAACGLVTPQGAWLLSAAVLFTAGLTRSMQFTCMNTLGFADLAPSQRSSGSTLHSMVLQVSTALGVAVAALLLQKSALLRHAASAGLPDFRLAFALVGLAGVLAALCYLQLPRDAGAKLIGETHG